MIMQPAARRPGPTRGLAWICAALLLPGTAAVLALETPPAVRRVQLLPGDVKALAPGRMLVAARGLPDPNFAETVVLLAQFDANGAMGVIVNRRTEVPLERLFPEMRRAPGESPLLFIGGPVSQTGVLGLLRSESPREDTRHVVADIHLVSARDPLEQLVAGGANPSRFRIYLGYAGWAPGQLEAETLRGSWHVFDGDGDVVFDPDPRSVWDRQIRRTEDRLVQSSPSRSRWRAAS